MSERERHKVEPGDEGRHQPESDPLWNESIYLDFVADDGAIAGYARIGLYPNLGVTWWTTMIVGKDRPVIASVAYDLPVARSNTFNIEHTDYALGYDTEAPLQVARLHCEAPARSHEEPAGIYRGDEGSAVPIKMDLAWQTDGFPYAYLGTTRYEIPCLVTGEIAVGDDVIRIDGQGQRDHSWGVRDWWDFGWCWASTRLDDGTRLHFTDVRIPGMPVPFGYVQVDGHVSTVGVLEVSEVLGPDGFPEHGTASLGEADIHLDIDPIAFGPVVLTATDGRTSRFPRAVARFSTQDGRSGLGWIEWNQPQPV